MVESGRFHGLPLNAKYAVYFMWNLLDFMVESAIFHGTPSTPLPLSLNAKYSVYFM